MSVNEKTSLQTIEELRKGIREIDDVIEGLRQLSYIDINVPRMATDTRITFKESVKSLFTRADVPEKEQTQALKTRSSIRAAIAYQITSLSAKRKEVFRTLNILEVSLDIKKVAYVRNTLANKIKDIEKSTGNQDVAILFKSATKAIRRYDYEPLNFNPIEGHTSKRSFITYKRKMIQAMTAYMNDLTTELEELNSVHKTLLEKE